MFLWNFWQLKNSLLELSSPLFTTAIYYPQTVNLSLHTLAIIPSFISVILQVFFNIITTYNILYLLSFVLSGLGTYLLVKLLAKNRIAAIISGVIFTFNPYIFAHAQAGHFNLLNTWPIPIFIYFLFKSIDDRSYKNLIYAALILALQSYIDFHYLLYLIIFALMFFAWQLAMNRNRLFTFKKILLGFFVWFILFLPLLIPTYKFYKDKDYNNWFHNVYKPDKAAFENTDFSSYYNISPFHPVFGDGYWQKIKTQTGGWAENTVFLGYTVLALAFGGLLFSKDKSKYFWLAIFLVFFSLSLGNSLQIEGKIYLDMPYGLIKKNILSNLDIVASRFVIMLYLSLAVFAAYFIKISQEKIQSIKLKYVIALVVLLLILFEYVPTLAVDNLKTSDFLKQIAQDNSNYTVLVLPETSRLAYLQTIYNKDTVGGYTGRRIHKYYIESYRDSPGLGAIFFAFDTKDIKIEARDLDRNAVTSNFENLKIRYIIIDRIAPFAKSNLLIDYLQNDLGFNLYYEDELIKVYKIE